MALKQFFFLLLSCRPVFKARLCFHHPIWLSEIFVLSGLQRAGRSQFNAVYEFKHRIRNTDVDMVVTSVTGHLMEHDFDGDFKNWGAVDPVALFDAPIIRRVPEVCESRQLPFI
jgi:hypothetical protein